MAQTTVFPHPGIHPSIAQRYSSRVYDPYRPVSREELLLLLEAARAAPSSSNRQPWRYLVFEDSNPEALEKARECLSPGNSWATKAPLLLLAVTEEIRPDGRINQSALHDLGLANQNILIQAAALGLNCRPIGGFDAEKARAFFDIPEAFTPVIMIALGYPAAQDDIPWDLLVRENQPRERKPIHTFTFSSTWNQTLVVEP